MDDIEQQIAMAKMYGQFLEGHAYIPVQDIPKYRKCYRKIYPRASMCNFD